MLSYAREQEIPVEVVAGVEFQFLAVPIRRRRVVTLCRTSCIGAVLV